MPCTVCDEWISWVSTCLGMAKGVGHIIGSPDDGNDAMPMVKVWRSMVSIAHSDDDDVFIIVCAQRIHDAMLVDDTRKTSLGL